MDTDEVLVVPHRNTHAVISALQFCQALATSNARRRVLCHSADHAMDNDETMSRKEEEL